MSQEAFPIRPYSPKELATLYCCNVKTFMKWLQHLQKELGPRTGHFYNPRQVRLIVNHLGTP